jgi:hypothetical protein
MQYRIYLSVIFLICATIVIAGCTGTQTLPGVPVTGSVAAPAGTPSPAGNLVVQPTEQLPSQNFVTVTVKDKDNYTGKFFVVFNGGMGQVHVKKIDVTLYKSDGTIQTATIGANKGDSCELDGTKQTDRVVVYVSFDNGDRMKTNDELVLYRNRNP